MQAQAYPNSHFVGIDIDQGAVAAASKAAEAEGLTNASFKVAGGCDAPWRFR